MTKSNTPLLSLGARGSLAGTLTFQQRPHIKYIRKKPIPTDPKSLPQHYQRWLYQDYVSYWMQQTEATKRQWQSAASRYHRTGLAHWMQYHLTNLPDIAGMWHLDYAIGAITPDSSKNINHGTIFGAFPITGVIDHGFYFDGINDRVDCGTDLSLRLTEDQTLECFIRTTKAACSIIERWRPVTNDRAISLYITGGMLAAAFSSNGIAGTFIIGTTIINDGKIHCVSLWHKNGVEIGLRVDGEEDAAPIPFVNGIHIGSPTFPFRIGGQNFLFSLDLIDEVIYYNRVLDLADHKRHSERRYP